MFSRLNMTQRSRLCSSLRVKYMWPDEWCLKLLISPSTATPATRGSLGRRSLTIAVSSRTLEICGSDAGSSALRPAPVRLSVPRAAAPGGAAPRPGVGARPRQYAHGHPQRVPGRREAPDHESQRGSCGDFPPHSHRHLPGLVDDYAAHADSYAAADVFSRTAPRAAPAAAAVQRCPPGEPTHAAPAGATPMALSTLQGGAAKTQRTPRGERVSDSRRRSAWLAMTSPTPRNSAGAA